MKVLDQSDLAHMPDRRLRVVMLVPGSSNPGGITQMLERWIGAGVARRVDLRLITDTRWDAHWWVQMAIAARAYALLMTYLSRRTTRPDVIHLHVSVRGGMYRELIAAAIARLWRVPVVPQIHSGQFFEWVRASRIAPFCARWLLSRADAVIVLAHRWIPDARDLGARRTVVVPHFVPTTLVKSLSTARATSVREAGAIDSLQLLFYGRWAHVKGVDVLARALAELPSHLRARINVRAFGNGDRDWLDKCMGEVPDVRLFVGGWLPDHDKPRELGRADAVVIPSRHEGFNQALLEAMAAGTPVIASAVGPVEEIIGSYPRAKLVPPGNSTALACVIRELAEGRWRPDEIASTKAQMRYSPKETMASLEGIYCEVVKSKKYRVWPT